MKDRIFYNDNVNLLETHNFTHNLQDVDEPHLFREMFDYESVPKTLFNFMNVPMKCAKNIWITDTTFRDGQQAQQPFTVKQIPKGLSVRANSSFIPIRTRKPSENVLSSGSNSPK